MRVLVVDDDRGIAETVRRMLIAEDWAVEVAHDGITGLAMAQQDPFDAIVCDVMMPGLSGHDVVRSLRAVDIWTPILMLSAKDGDHDQADALGYGADDYLTKPFSYVVLIARLRAITRRGVPQPRSVLRSGNLVADPSAHTAHRSGTEIVLARKEFALLEHFLTNQGRVLSKADILDAVWGPDFRGDESVVEVYVSYLRQKIDKPFGTGSITTVRGVGYRFDG